MGQVHIGIVPSSEARHAKPSVETDAESLTALVANYVLHKVQADEAEDKRADAVQASNDAETRLSRTKQVIMNRVLDKTKCPKYLRSSHPALKGKLLVVSIHGVLEIEETEV